MNLCRACGEDFGSVSAFDAHRVGKHECTFSTTRLCGRRCLTTNDLLERHWTRDGHGRWRRPSDGAPWALRETQVTTQTRVRAARKDLGRQLGARRPVRLPDPENARLAK